MRTNGPSNSGRRALGLVAGLTVVSVLVASSPHASSATRSTKARASRVAPDFTTRFVEDQQSVVSGQTATYTLQVRPNSTFKGAVVFDMPNLTDRFTGRIIPNGSTEVTLEITVPPFAATNSGVFILRARSGTIVRQSLFRLNVTARPVPTTTAPPATASSTIPPQIGLTAVDVTRTAQPGVQVQYGIGITRAGGFAGEVNLRVDGLPTGTTGTFAPNPTSAGSVMYITPSDTTPSGTYLLSVVAQAGSTVRAVAVVLIVTRTGDFGLSLAPASVNVPAGNDAVSAINVLKVGTNSSFSSSVTFTATGLPPGATALFDPNPSNGLTTVRIRTATTTALGAYNVVIRATSGSIVRTITLRVTVDKSTIGGFGIVGSPTSGTAAAGSEAIYNIAITPVGGFNSPITFTVRNLPPFATATIASQTATAAVVRVVTDPATPAGQYPLLVTGTSGTLSATVSVNLVVT